MEMTCCCLLEHKCKCKCHSNNRNNSRNNNRNKNFFRNIWFILAISICLFTIGVLGFYTFHISDWVTAVYDTTAIMSAVGAADEPHSTQGKIFASFFTMFTGLFYIFLISYFVTSFLVSQEMNDD